MVPKPGAGKGHDHVRGKRTCDGLLYFAGDVLADGDTLAVAVVLHGARGEALRTVYATGRVADGRFPGRERVYRASAELDLADGERDALTSFTFLAAKYYAIREMDDAEVAQALRRAVGRVTEEGAGAEVWAAAGR